MTLASEVTTAAKAVETGVSAFFEKLAGSFTLPADLKDDADKLLTDAGTAATTAATHEAESLVPAAIQPEVDPLIAEGLALLKTTLEAKLAQLEKLSAPTA